MAGAVAGAVAEGDEADGVVGVVAPPEEGPAGAELLPEALDPEAEELEPLPTQLVEAAQQIQKTCQWPTRHRTEPSGTLLTSPVDSEGSGLGSCTSAITEGQPDGGTGGDIG